jgi:hypothetical protein
VAIKDFAVRVGQDEIGRILNLKENLNQKDLLLSYAPHYQQLGWVLVGMKVPDGGPLDLDLSKPVEQWCQQFFEADTDQIQINIGIRTGKVSGLLVLEVNKGEGALSLDQWGDWGAACIAEMGGRREQHYYALPAHGQTPPSYFLAPQVLIYGEGGMVLTPPSMESPACEPWRWVRPPWESPPQAPPPAVWQFLKEYIPATLLRREVPTWTEIYRVIAPHGPILKALLDPPTSQDDYYQGILKAAIEVGLQEPSMLLGLLWHAPHGEDRNNPEKWGRFEKMVSQAQGKPAGDARGPGLPAKLDGGSWPNNPGAGSELSTMPTLPSGLEALARFSGSGASDLERQETGESPAARFNQSVSGQFFQLLAGLGEKVIMESCRYEAMVAGLKTKAGEIDGMVSQWEQYFVGSSPLPPEQESKAMGNTVEFNWDSIVNLNAYKKQQAHEIQTAAHDFLTQNPDLASDRDRVQMVIFCLKNYVTINPEYANLPFREKLNQAGTMARGFLGMERAR